ncbi:hypothetical protein [Psittacicella hinzii]|uniref:DUF4919 domain-containing protein n=1 Tax=Psittacicella hinzii TaxID=2028575 RepID=A0A3A1YND4_9GAMM|nr:hypothetical protein [Psittacicella hinzii]RIY38748.1 hypothetical protein CKF58_03465 [Psittacicella hinzii]
MLNKALTLTALLCCFGMFDSAQAKVNPVDKYSDKLKAIVANNPELLNLSTDFVVNKLLQRHQGQTITFAIYNHLLLTNFYQPLNTDYTLTRAGYDSISIDNYLKVVATCQQMKKDLPTKEAVDLDKKYKLICSKATIIYMLSGATDDYVRAYGLRALTYNQETNQKLVNKDELDFKPDLPSYSYLVEQGILPRLREQFRIVVTLEGEPSTNANADASSTKK